MTTPTPDWQGVTVRWRGKYLDGTPAAGTIDVAVPVNRFLDDDPSTPVTILGRSLAFTIDNQGEAEFTLPATDDPDITPRDFTYTVTERVQGMPVLTYALEAPLSAMPAGIELNRVVAAEPSPGTPVSLVTRAQFDALAADVAALESGTAGVSSVNTRSGAVVLSIADVNASGTRDNTTYLRGDATWATPAGGGGHDHDALDMQMPAKAPATPPMLKLTQPDDTTAPTDAELVQVFHGAAKTSWLNEWGALRTRIPSNKTGDSVFKGFWSTAYTGVPFQLIKDGGATTYQFAVHADGSVSLAELAATPSNPPAGMHRMYPTATGWRSKNAAGTVERFATGTEADALDTRMDAVEARTQVLVLAPAAPVPGGTPVGTVILRTL
jgi:hypothetical protein